MSVNMVMVDTVRYMKTADEYDQAVRAAFNDVGFSDRVLCNEELAWSVRYSRRVVVSRANVIGHIGVLIVVESDTENWPDTATMWLAFRDGQGRIHAYIWESICVASPIRFVERLDGWVDMMRELSKEVPM